MNNCFNNLFCSFQNMNVSRIQDKAFHIYSGKFCATKFLWDTLLFCYRRLQVHHKQYSICTKPQLTTAEQLRWVLLRWLVRSPKIKIELAGIHDIELHARIRTHLIEFCQNPSKIFEKESGVVKKNYLFLHLKILTKPKTHNTIKAQSYQHKRYLKILKFYKITIFQCNTFNIKYNSRETSMKNG